MASVRSRITGAYGVAMVGAMVAFAIVILAQRRASTINRLTEDATNTATIVSNIISRQGFRGVSVDTASGSGPLIAPMVASLLDGLPGYIVVGDTGQVFYVSPSLRKFQVQATNPALSELTRTSAKQDFDNLTRNAYSIGVSGVPRRVHLNSDDILLVASIHDPPLTGGVRRVVAGVSTSRVDDVTAELAGITFIVAPILVILAIFIAWVLAGRVLEPIDRMVNDVAAVTDGRSLHRRVVLPSESFDEFSRLGQTVNEMIGRLESSFASLRRFTADASHELRTPLAVIRADVERAMSGQQNSHEQAVALEEALQQVSRMTGLVEALLTLARADEGRFELVREHVKLEPLVREVAETAQILGEEAGITVKLSVDQPAAVQGDAERLRQLFLNLATNAVKYTGRGGNVEISLDARHDEAIVMVKDDGIGIAAADLPFIFDRFWRVDRARSRTEGGGAGLGLAISQWIAQAHDGRIDVTSRLGRGSTFTVVLPTATEGKSGAETPNSGLSIS